MLRAPSLRAGLLLCTLALGMAATPVLDANWKTSIHERLGKAVGGYFEAYNAQSGSSEAWEDLSEAIAKHQKKIKDVPILSCVEDWELVFRSEALSNYKVKPRKGRLLEETLDFRGTPIDVAMLFPSSYSSKGEPSAIILIACEPGTTPKECLAESWMNADLRDSAILVAIGMPEDQEALVGLGTPQALGGITLLMGSYGSLKQTYAIDMDRVFLAGHGEGAMATMTTAAAFPHVFAGVIVRAGIASVPVVNFRTVPSLWLASGESGTNFEEAATEAEIGNVTVAAGAGDDEVLAWMADKVRDAYPMRVSYAPVNATALSTSWISMEGASAEAGSKLEATVDRDNNTITIDGEGIVSINISLNDVLVDLSKPVKVIINGRTEEALMARNQRTMVQMMFSGGDWGRVFTVTRSYDFDE